MHFLRNMVLTFLTIFLFLNSPAQGSHGNGHKKVLVLFSLSSTLPVTSQWVQSIRSVFEEETSIKIKLDIEYLDMSRFNNNEYIQMMLNVFDHKYSKSKPDLIIPLYKEALTFVQTYGQDLFPGVPILFAGVDEKDIGSQDLRPGIKGVFQSDTYHETLQLALNLHPDTENVVVVAGGGLQIQSMVKALKKACQLYEDRLDFMYLINVSLDELLKKVAKLPAKTIILYLPVILDNAGNSYVANKVIQQLSNVTNAPMYSFWDIMLGHGIVGGSLKSWAAWAKVVAETGVLILKGTRIENVDTFQTHSSKDMFDWRQLKRWSIPESRLPEDSIVKFIVFSGWDLYKGYIIGAFLMVVFQSLGIFYLLHQQRKRRRAEEGLLLAEKKYRTVADYTYDWEYWENSDGKLQYVSPSCERICGYTAQDIVNKPSIMQDLILPEDKKIWDEHKCDNKGKNSDPIQFRIQKSNGSVCWIEHVCQPVLDRQGNVQGVRGSNRDVTQREFYKSETHLLKSELEHMDRVATISTLTSALAHEINQPLAAMRSYAQAALRFLDQDPPNLDRMKKAMKGVVSDNKRASAVVNRLRDLVKKKTTYWEVFQINSLIKNVIKLINSEIILRNASIKLDLHHSNPKIYGESIQIQQVMINLLTNALDAMDEHPAEPPTITISTIPENSGSIMVSVSDTGMGIPMDDVQDVFYPFHTTKEKGLGLGLAICKSIVKTHGGKIWAENNPGGGATFFVVLPAGGQTG